MKVSGNCSSCKKHIETASKVEGVSSAAWNKNTHLLTISYNPAKITNDQIQKNVAAVGYDTEKYKANDNAYNNLDECCQYDRKSATSVKKKL